MITLLKLGGSLITDKNKPHTARYRTIHRLAEEISRARSECPEIRLILGHGSGSFGHVPAKKYGTRDRVGTSQEWAGFLEVWNEARALHLIVCDALQSARLPVISFPPSAAVFSHGRVKADWNTLPLESALNTGFIPVIYGDVIFDSETGGTILSTEELFLHLAEKLPVDRFLIAGKDTGVFADFPACQTVINTISLSDIQLLENSIHASAAVDVTGGMREKVLLAAKMVSVSAHASALIFSGDRKDLVYHALKGENNGTLIYKD